MVTIETLLAEADAKDCMSKHVAARILLLVKGTTTVTNHEADAILGALDEAMRYNHLHTMPQTVALNTAAAIRAFQER